MAEASTEPRIRSRILAHMHLGVAAVVCMAVAALVGAAPRSVGAEPSPFPEPPAGGLTQGVAGTADPAAVVAAQTFDVETVSVLDPETQRWLVYVPGAPAAANTLSAETLSVDSIVTIRRAGATAPGAAAPAAPVPAPAVSGEGTPFEPPPLGGLVQGVAGTNDPETLAARQEFTVESLSLLHVPSQTWLVYVPSAPSFASTLRRGLLTETSIVTVRRASPPPAPVPTASPAPTVAPTDVNTTAEEVVLASVNEERVAAGLEPLESDPTMVEVARAHSRDMLARDFFDHVNPDGDDPFDRMRVAGVEFGYAAENIVSGQSGASAHATLMGSPPHRANILGERYRRIGIGAISRPGGGVIVTQVFAD